MKNLFLILSFVWISYFSSTLYAGQLDKMWGDLINKYPPPKPTVKERKTISDLFQSVLHNYPDHLIHRNNLNYDELHQYASPYLKTHIFKRNKKKYCQQKIKPFQAYIRSTSLYFDVPAEIIGAVILQESSGNPRAKAKSSSAKGLMQTIDATFEFARKNLLKNGIIIKNPYSPLDSIRAGTWYLSYVFELAKQDWPSYHNRSLIHNWEKALEYYYAGPVWGKNPKPIFHAYINGKVIVIKKALYSKKVLEYASLL